MTSIKKTPNARLLFSVTGTSERSGDYGIRNGFGRPTVVRIQRSKIFYTLAFFIFMTCKFAQNIPSIVREENWISLGTEMTKYRTV